MKKLFPESKIYGCDISEESLKIARKINPDVQYDKIITADDLTRIYKKTFDCIFISNVFHHIPFNEHKTWLDALYSLLSNGGGVYLYLNIIHTIQLPNISLIPAKLTKAQSC